MTLYTRGFDCFVNSAATPIAAGWSDSCRVGVSYTEELRLSRRTEKSGLAGAILIGRAVVGWLRLPATIELLHIRFAVQT